MKDSAVVKKLVKTGECSVCGRSGVEAVTRRGKKMCADEAACLTAWKKARKAS